MKRQRMNLKTMIFLLLAVCICSMSVVPVLAETVEEAAEAQTEHMQDSNEDVTKTWKVKPEIHLDRDYDDGVVCSSKPKFKITGYVTDYKKNGIKEVYFNNTSVALKEDGSFSKTVSASLIDTKKYRISIRDEEGDIISAVAIQVYLTDAPILLCIMGLISGVAFIIFGFCGLRHFGHGTGIVIIGIIIVILGIAIIPILYFV